MKKETRGRKALPEKEKKKPLYIMVKQKFVKEVNPKLKELERDDTIRLMSQEPNPLNSFFIEMEHKWLKHWYERGIVEEYLHKNDASDKRFSAGL